MKNHPESAQEATGAAMVAPMGVINPLAIVRRAGPLVPIQALIRKGKRKKKPVNAVDTSPRRAFEYPVGSVRVATAYGPGAMSSVYPYVSG